MKYGSWAESGIAKFTLSNLGLVVCLMFIGATQGLAGFSLGNGTVMSVNPGGDYTVRPFAGLEVNVRAGAKTRLVAPKEDGVYPRTELTVMVSPANAGETALKALLNAGTGWISFVRDGFVGAHREEVVDSHWGISRLEVHYVNNTGKLTMVLEGKKNLSKAYANAAEQLMEEFE